MTAPRTDARPRQRGEEGVSLIELLVTIVLVGVLGGMVFSSLVGLNEAVAVADSASVDQGFGRNAMRLVTRDVRAAARIPSAPVDDPAFRTAARDEAAFTSRLTQGDNPELVRIQVDADNRLLVTQTPPSATAGSPVPTFAPGDAQQRYVTSFVVNPVNRPIFEYLDVDGVALTGFTGPDGSLPIAERRRIASVRITLLLNQAPLLTGSTELTTTVRLPNAGARN